MKLSREKYLAASKFIEKYARPLDKRRFEFHFKRGTKEEVLKELRKFQNTDGGFGHAIEPDLRAKVSSPYATTVGIQHYLEIGDPTDRPMIKNAIQYLIETYDSENKYWPAVFEDVNEEPHAPWWHVSELKRPKGADWANPSAEIVGYLELYSDYVPPDLLDEVRKECTRNLKSLEYIDSWLYNVMCWERAYTYFPDQLKVLAKNKIHATFDHHHPMTNDTLGEIRITWIAPTKNSILATQYPEVFESLLEEEIGRQADNGGWWPTWQWGQYEEEWEIAKQEWAGKITVDCLLCLKEYDML